jgi:hypothetical protein
MKLKKLLLVLLLIISGQCYGYDFQVDGIYYNYVSGTENSCKVTSGNYKYTGSVIIPEAVTVGGKKYNVVQIEQSAFSGCSELSNVSIPSSVTSIGASAFKNCTSLLKIEVPNSVQSIGNSAFYGCNHKA